jgi:hypothetical protein
VSRESSLRRLYEQHKKLRFPDELATAEIEGETLLLLDTNAAGCICGFFSGDKGPALDANRVRILEQCLAKLTRICPQLSEEHQPYFGSLRTLIEGIVTYCRRQEA